MSRATYQCTKSRQLRELNFTPPHVPNSGGNDFLSRLSSKLFFGKRRQPSTQVSSSEWQQVRQKCKKLVQNHSFLRYFVFSDKNQEFLWFQWESRCCYELATMHPTANSQSDARSRNLKLPQVQGRARSRIFAKKTLRELNFTPPLSRIGLGVPFLSRSDSKLFLEKDGSPAL